MLYVFGFERTAVAVSDLYFIDPHPRPGQEGAERGVRLEVRLLERAPLKGSIYSAQPIGVGRPVWRADLLESAGGPPGSFDRTHYHPALVGWEPGDRVFDPGLSAHPVEWVSERLGDLQTLLAEAKVPAEAADARDAEALRGCVPEIAVVLARLLERVRAGELALAPLGDPAASARTGWL